jgi:hypothetical protein
MGGADFLGAVWFCPSLFLQFGGLRVLRIALLGWVYAEGDWIRFVCKNPFTLSFGLLKIEHALLPFRHFFCWRKIAAVKVVIIPI